MSAKTGISWTQATFNPVTGCSPVSTGCRSCYARTMTKRLQATGVPKYAAGFDRVICHPECLEEPLRWKEPRMIFVGSMSDLLHEDVPFNFVASVMGTIILTPWHRYQILTKRSKRMLLFYDWWMHTATREHFMDLQIALAIDRLGPTTSTPERLRRANDYYLNHYDQSTRGRCDGPVPWPLPNAWVGVTAENADYLSRINDLRRVNAAVRFISLEPLLGPLPNLDLTGISQVIVGGESGIGARPMDPAWARDIRDQCLAAGVSFFMKQMSGRAPIPDDLMIREFPK